MSQVSYIVLGVAVMGPLSTIGALAHLVHQGLMKITLFFAAGNIAETLGAHKVSELDGVGRRLPFTMAAFTIGALGMIGVPPVAGYVSKFYLATGAADSQQWWVIAVLAGSSLLNAMYFLPILYRAWFKPQRGPWPHEEPGREAKAALLVPTLLAALFALGVGVMATMPMSPLEWTRLIAEREFGYAAGLATQAVEAPLSGSALVYALPMLPPLLVLVVLLVNGQAAWQRLRVALLPLAALPALAVALGAPHGSVDLPWLLLGARFELGDTTRWFLLFTAVLWAAAALYAASYLHHDARRGRFDAFFLAAMAGNFGLVMAGDAASFYVFFALMSFASYGLVVHSRQGPALQAGRVYIALVVIGELALFAAVALAARAADSLLLADISAALATTSAPTREAVIMLLVVAFGIKAGVLGLHMWLPLAHPAAPVPASAVLSGAMIKAGLLGWLQFMPLGSAASGWGEVLVMLGVAAAVLGALVGALQHEVKAALAYSSISQMGFMTVAVGVALAVPSAAPAAVLAATVLAFHHGFAKAALFLGVGLAGAATPLARALLIAGVALPALALAGAPWTSGAAAKLMLKDAIGDVGPPWLPALLTFAAVGTTLVMARVTMLVWRKHSDPDHPSGIGMWMGWALLVLGSVGALWVLSPSPLPLGAAGIDVVSALWPIALGVMLAAVFSTWAASRDRPLVPPGDLIAPLLRPDSPATRAEPAPPAAPALAPASPTPAAALGVRLERYDAALMRVAMLTMAVLGAVVVGLSVAGS